MRNHLDYISILFLYTVYVVHIYSIELIVYQRYNLYTTMELLLLANRVARNGLKFVFLIALCDFFLFFFLLNNCFTFHLNARLTFFATITDQTNCEDKDAA